jgi:hypothetical protein
MKHMSSGVLALFIVTIALVLVLSANAFSQISGTKAIPGDYPNLGNALEQISSSGLSGPAVLELQAGYTGSPLPLSLHAIPGSSSVNTLTIRPAAGASGIVLTNAFSDPTLQLQGASNIIIDGRPGGTGTARELTIENTATDGVALRFVNSAKVNIVRYCILKGANTSLPGGVVVFGTSSVTNGNVFEAIMNCIIRDASGGVPANAIYSSGTVDAPNSNNIISDNEILNFSNSGIYITSTGNGGAWTIGGNSFYNTLSTPPSTPQTAINFKAGTTSNNNSIAGNFIGGHAASATGSAWTNTGAVDFVGIYLSAGASVATSLHNNSIQNLALTSTGSVKFTGVSIASGIVGNNGNVIGSTSTPNSITVAGSSTTTGIEISSDSSVSISSDVIANISATGTGAGVSIRGIFAHGTGPVGFSGNSINKLDGPNIKAIVLDGSLSNNSITGNLIGGNSINDPWTSLAVSEFTGIYVSAGSTTETAVHNNIIQNLALTSTGPVKLISYASGIVNNNGNVIGSASTPNSITVAGSSTTTGIEILSASSVSISNDVIANISATGTGAGVSIRGILAQGTGPVAISGNSINKLDGPNIKAIVLDGSLSNNNISGNLIGGNSINDRWTSLAASEFTGIYVSAAPTSTTSLHNNILHNIALTNTGPITFTGISLAGSIIGNSGNVIGSSSTPNSITVAGSATTTGIQITSSSAVSISDDIVANITASGTGAGVAVRGIVHHGTGAATISGNAIHDLVGLSARGILVESPNGTVTATLRRNTVTGRGTGTGIGASVMGTASLNLTASDNTVSNWGKGFLLSKDPGAMLQLSLEDNGIAGNQFGMDNQTGIQQNATCNWWGAASGPSGAGPGTGDAVSSNVVFNPWATIPTFVAVDAGPDKIIYIGYGSQSATLTAIATSCGGASYLWSTGAITSSITVSPTTTSTYTVAVTDPRGHTASDQVAVNVEDVRCGNNNDKVRIYHRGSAICVSRNAIPAHLAHGDVFVLPKSTAPGDPTGQTPEKFALSQNYPNPFNPSTKIQFQLAASGFVSLKVYDVLGREVRTLVNENLKAGSYETTFSAEGGSASGGDARELASGVYFYRLGAGDFLETKRLLLVK